MTARSRTSDPIIARSSQCYTLASHILHVVEATLLKVFNIKYDQMEKIDVFNVLGFCFPIL